MTNDSKFVLRWEIDRSALERGRVETGVIECLGYKWSNVMVQRNDELFSTLRCDSDHNGPWKCEAKVDEITFKEEYSSVSVCCDPEEDSLFWRNSLIDCEFNTYLNHQVYIYLVSTVNNGYNSIFLQFNMRLISSTREEVAAEPSKFGAPNEMSNVILKIGEQKLHVSKEYLAVHSPVFKTLFFGTFAEKGKEEVEIKDVEYKEFLDLLDLIYLGPTKITGRTVQHILKLADQFQMQSVTDQAVAFLTQTGEIDAMTKLLYAEQFRLATLKDHCLNSFTSATELTQQFKAALQKPLPFSEEMKSAIKERIGHLAVGG